MRRTLAITVFVLLGACRLDATAGDSTLSVSPQDSSAGHRLDEVLAARPEDLKARDIYRHPRETMEFCGLKPGMAVAEISPGAGWYTKIIAPVIGPESGIYGLYYNPTMWRHFGERYTEEQIQKRKVCLIPYGSLTMLDID